jgi:DNA-binding transcriptional ArsR family regulator
MEKNPGISTSELAKLSGTSIQVVNYHVRKLWRMDLVTLDREGRVSRCYIRPKELAKYKIALPKRKAKKEPVSTDT